MSKRFRHSVPAFLQVATVLLAATPSLAGWGSLNKDYGGSLQMRLYTPGTPSASPAVLVALHYCGGNSSNATWFDSAAEKNGFYVIAPDAGGGANVCFDASLGRSGERADIVKMVQWVIDTKNADKNRVFAAGFSSGGCMTNTLLAIYPDVFAGGAAMPGVAAGGWPQGKSCPCGQTWSTQTNPTDGKFWGDKARAVFQWSGTRPCVQEWVGESDEYGFAKWMPTVAAQFQDLGGLGAGSPGSGAPSGWNRTVYKDSSGNVRLETNTKPGQAHNLIGAVPADAVISFLGLDKPTGACGLTTTGGGGAGSGGASSTGGASGGGAANGGAAGGMAKGGGSNSNGGSANGTGGSSNGTGGSSTSSGGGPIANGGAVSLAGGSSNASGGATTNSSGGTDNTSSGGSTNIITGGAVSKGGATAAGGSSNTAGSGGSGGSDSGCSCSAVGAHQHNVPFSSVVGLALCAGFVARKRSRRNP